MRYFLHAALLLTLGVALIATPAGAWKRHGSTPPIITNIVATSIDTQTEQVTWTTNVLSNTVVNYDVQSGIPYASSQWDGTAVTSHSITLTNLSPGILYYYVVQSYGGVSTELTFTTAAAPPVLVTIRAVSVDYQHETITWTSDQLSNSVVHYGLTSAYGSTASDATLVTVHSVPLSGLSGSTTYHYNVASTAATGTTTSVDKNFLTVVTPTPVISSIAASSLSATSEQVTWTTNISSDSTVNYGLTSSYGSIVTDSSLVTSHSLDLTQLTPSTIYHYDVASGGTISADQTFTTVTGVASLGVRLFVHNYPKNSEDGLVNTQTGGSEYTPTDPYVCGSQTIIGWNYVARNGAHFTGATSGTTLTVTNLSGQTIHTGDSFAIAGATGLPTISAVPGGGASSTANGSYTLSATQPTIAATDAWTMQEDWTDVQALLDYYHPYGKKVELLFGSAFAQTPQLMTEPSQAFNVAATWSGTSASPTYTLHITGIPGGKQICETSQISATGGLNFTTKATTTAFTGTNTGAFCSSTDGDYPVWAKFVTSGSQTVTVTPTFSSTPTYVLDVGDSVDSYTYVPGTLNSSNNVSSIQCHSDHGDASNAPSPPTPNYLGKYYRVPWLRFVADVVAHFGSNQDVAVLHFPIGGMEQYPITTADSNCQTLLDDMGYATVVGSNTKWFNWATDFIDFLASLSSPVQFEIDTGASIYDSSGVWWQDTAAYITSHGFMVGSNDFPDQSFTSGLWGTYCPKCFAEPGSASTDWTSRIMPAAQNYLTSPAPPSPSYNIHLLHMYGKEEYYTWKNSGAFGPYNATFQAYYASLNPPPVQGPSCRIPAGGS